MKCPACLTDSDLVHQYKYTPTTMDKLKLFDERKIICCPNCNFGMIEKDVDEHVLQHYYSSDYSGKARKQAETKAKAIDLRTNHSVDLRSISQLALISQYLDVQSNVTVVEIGPGMGNFLFALRQMNFVGKHVAFEPQQQAHKFLEQLGSSVEGYNFDISGAKKLENSVDLVVMSHSLEHFNPGKVAGIMSAVSLMLKKGGIFFCEVPNANLTKYPNAGEMVVPHLSFFSLDSVRYFIKNSNLDLLFIDACGVSQFSKNTAEEIDKLKGMGHFVYDLDENTGILRNRSYHRFLERERLRLGKKQRLMNFISSVLGAKNLLSLLDWIRKIKQESLVSLVSSKYFSYGNDREYLRFIAKK